MSPSFSALRYLYLTFSGSQPAHQQICSKSLDLAIQKCASHLFKLDLRSAAKILRSSKAFRITCLQSFCSVNFQSFGGQSYHYFWVRHTLLDWYLNPARVLVDIYLCHFISLVIRGQKFTRDCFIQHCRGWNGNGGQFV